MTDPRPIPLLRGRLDATVRPPGSKSETIRTLFAAALATGASRLHFPLDSEDTRSAREAVRLLGAGVVDHEDPWIVAGAGGRLSPPDRPLDAGASGLTARTLIALAALADGTTTVTGRDRLPSRPMAGVVAALTDLGIDVSSEGGLLPITIAGTGSLPGGRVEVPSAETTQHLTALLLAAPCATAPLTLSPVGLEGSQGYIEMTLRVMRRFGAEVEAVEDGYRVSPTGYRAAEVRIEPDASAAVYPMVAAAITGGRVIIEGLGSGSLQPDMEVVRVLEAMGCIVSRDEGRTTVTGRDGALDPVDVDLSGAPDGSLAVAVACLFADGPSLLRGLGSLRFKESDRLAAIAAEIDRIGGGAVVEGDRLLITPAPLHPARIETYQDHRIAMAMALVGLVTPGIEVANPSVVAKTWPGYWSMLESLAGQEG